MKKFPYLKPGPFGNPLFQWQYIAFFRAYLDTILKALGTSTWIQMITKLFARVKKYLIKYWSLFLVIMIIHIYQGFGHHYLDEGGEIPEDTIQFS